MHKIASLVTAQIGILQHLKFPVDDDIRVLDLGSGNGTTVYEYRAQGFDCFGCDLQFKDGLHKDELVSKGYLRIITDNPYTLPFEENMFDLVVSSQVLEHVSNYKSTLSELSRVLKPGGAHLHIFPSRLRFLEVHTNIPLGSILRNRFWLYIWAFLGVRSKWQQGNTIKQTVEANYNYLRNHTNYLSKSALRNYFLLYSERIEFCERYLLKYGNTGKYLYSLPKFIPFIPFIYSTFRSRAIFAINKKKLF